LRSGLEKFCIRKDGSRIRAAGEMSPVRSDAGAVVGFTKVVRDRTAQRRAEDATEQERRSLQILNRAGTALAIETDLARLVQIVTDAGVELTGAEFGAFFYNLIDEAGERYMLYTLSGAPLEALLQHARDR
jgi:PAS domain-containing protein